MRCWRAPDFRLVVETDHVLDLRDEAYPLHLPEGGRIEHAHTYYIATAGEVEEILAPAQTSAQEWLYTDAYVCTPSDGEWLLRRVGCGDSSSAHQHSSHSGEVVLDRLQPLPPDRCPSEERLDRSAEALRVRRGREHEERERQLEDERRWLRSADELPGVPGNAPLDLVWDTERAAGGSSPAMTVIRSTEGTRIWMEQADFGGQHRFAAVHRLLRERYGERLRSFEPNLENPTCQWYWTTD